MSQKVSASLPTGFSWKHQQIKGLPAAVGKPTRIPYGRFHLFLVVSTTGHKSWSWQAWVGGDIKSKTISLGGFDTIGVKEAVSLAEELDRELADGRLLARLSQGSKKSTPALQRTATGDTGMTCREAWDIYIADLEAPKAKGEGSKNGPKTIEDKRNYWRKHLADEIGDMPITEVTRDDLEDIVDTIRDEGKESTAHNFVAYTRAFFNFCLHMRKSKLTGNPAQFIKTRPPGARKRRLSHEEIRWLWKALDDEDDVWADGYRLCLLTGQRKSEIFGLMLQEVNSENRYIDLPPERTKNNLQHLVPAGPLAWAIVERRAKQADQFLFRSLDPLSKSHVSGFSRAQNRIRKAVEKLAKAEGKAVDHWKLHDLRRTVSSEMNGYLDAEENSLISADHVEVVLNHITGSIRAGVAGVYNHHAYLKEKRRALTLWEQRLTAILAG